MYIDEILAARDHRANFKLKSCFAKGRGRLSERFQSR
jgi:hypothetical protein